MSRIKTNDFKGQIKLTVRTDGDGIGFDFGEFFIWKNSSHRYFIKNNSGQYWCRGGLGGWLTSFRDETGMPQVCYYNSLREAIKKANELFSIEPYDSKKEESSILLEKNYNRFDLMDMEE